MKIQTRILLVSFLLCFVTQINAQPINYNIKNGIGIQAGITLYDIDTDNFITKQGNGFIGGMAATVELPHRWYTVSWGMLFSEQNFEISGRMTDDVNGEEAIGYNLKMIQLAFMFHAKILGPNLTLDAGPQLQYNGEMELKNSLHEDYFINNYAMLSASDITDITKLNANGVVGLTAGLGRFRIRASYTHGFTNILNNLNNTNLDVGSNNTEFKGNQKIMAFSMVITL